MFNGPDNKVARVPVGHRSAIEQVLIMYCRGEIDLEAYLDVMDKAFTNPTPDDPNQTQPHQA